MHAADPVQWQTWGPEVLTRARREGKLVFVSSGYFACHWCHVMQRESFRDPEVAAFLNRHVIAVKVDRELLPALDAQLLAFVSRTRGRAGWPLNVFLTPEGNPLIGVVYLPRDQFLDLARQLQARWRKDRTALAALAEAGMRELARPAPEPPALGPGEGSRLADGLVREALAAADDLAGGFGHESKFPASPQLVVLLELQRRRPDPGLAAFLRLTLDQMARLGLHDPLAGGFFRYTIDPGWHTPHFEKMLYDNAQLAEVYRRAADILGEPRYAEVSRSTLDFLLDTMADPTGGFVASLSAVDDAGVEGGYYRWSDEALGALLTEPERQAVAIAWELAGQGGEAGALPMAAVGPTGVGARLGLRETEARVLLESGHRKLLAARQRRTLPRDTKLIAGWNGLALASLARAGAAPGGERYHQAAARLAGLLKARLVAAEGLHRALADGRPAGEAAFEDYAYVAAGLLAWTETSGDPAAQEIAVRLADAAWRRFRTPAGWSMGTASGTLPLGDAEAVLPDGPTPSPSAVLLRVSLAIADRTGDEALRRRALNALGRDYPALSESPLLHASHILLLLETGQKGTQATGRSATD